jgi:hypothetical protein
MALHSQNVFAATRIGSIIAPCRLPMRHKLTLPKPFVAQYDLCSIPKSVKYASKRRKTGATVSASQSMPLVDDDSSNGDFCMQSYTWKGPSTNGQLSIAPLEAHEVGAASVVLTRAFATSPQGVPIEDGR